MGLFIYNNSGEWGCLVNIATQVSTTSLDGLSTCYNDSTRVPPPPDGVEGFALYEDGGQSYIIIAD